MSDVKRLLDEATPLPWTVEWGPDRWSVAVTDNGDADGVWAEATREPNDGAYRESRNASGPDAALIVYAVNNLPAYEAAVDALEWFVQFHSGHVLPPELGNAMTTARAALRHLRGDIDGS